MFDEEQKSLGDSSARVKTTERRKYRYSNDGQTEEACTCGPLEPGGPCGPGIPGSPKSPWKIKDTP